MCVLCIHKMVNFMVHLNLCLQIDWSTGWLFGWLIALGAHVFAPKNSRQCSKIDLH